MSLNKIKINNTTTVNTGVVYDITKATGQSYDSLSAALGTNGNNVPLEVREGGMSARFVSNDDNKYVQYRLMADSWSINTDNWSFCGNDVLIENLEYIQVTTDSENKILEGISSNGVKKINIPIDISGIVIEHTDDNPEWMNVTIDSEGRVLGGRKLDGTVVENLEVQIKGIGLYETVRHLTDEVSIVNKLNQQAVKCSAIIDNRTREFYDISELGQFLYVHVFNHSEKATTLPMNFYDSNKVYAGVASTYFKGTESHYEENVKYGRVYLKAGEEATVLIINKDGYKYLGIETNKIPDNVKISLDVCTKSYGQYLQKTGIDIPFLGCGKFYIQPMDYNYSHGSQIANIGKYLLVSFCGCQQNSNNDTLYPSSEQLMTLAIIEKGNYNNIVYKIFDGYPSSSSLYKYVQSTRMFADGNNLNILYTTHNGVNTPYIYYLRKFDTLTFQFSEPQKLYLNYNGETVEWNKGNELRMLNWKYGSGLSIIENAPTEAGSVRYYDGYYYTIIGGAGEPTAHKDYPWNILRSADAITWEPVACIEPNGASAELIFDIVDGIMLIQIRSNDYSGYVDYNGYMVCDIDGNILKSPTYLSSVDSKGAVFVKNSNLYIAYNIESDSTYYFKRNKLAIAKLNTGDYSLTVLQTFTDKNGYQYFDFNCKDDVVFMSNTEDPRGYNYSRVIGPYGGCVSVAIVNDDVFQDN